MKPIAFYGLILATAVLSSCEPGGGLQDEQRKDDPRPARTFAVGQAFVHVELKNPTADDDALVEQITDELQERLEADFLPEGSVYRFFDEMPDQIYNRRTDETTEVRLDTETDENGSYFIITHDDGTENRFIVDLTEPYLIKDYTQQYADNPRVLKVLGRQKLNALL